MHELFSFLFPFVPSAGEKYNAVAQDLPVGLTVNFHINKLTQVKCIKTCSRIAIQCNDILKR